MCVLPDLTVNLLFFPPELIQDNSITPLPKGSTIPKRYLNIKLVSHSRSLVR